MDEFQGSGQALRPASAYRPSAVASGSDFARAKSPWKEEEEEEEEEDDVRLATGVSPPTPATHYIVRYRA